jgi:hypothetical protein
VKRVLFDENMPRKLRRDLPEMLVRTVQEEQWAGFKNGQLLQRASGVFDVLLTVDQGLRHQQNVSKFNIGVVVLETDDTTLPNLRTMLPEIRAAVQRAKPGTVIVITPA